MSPRRLFFAIFLTCAGLIGYAYYLQYWQLQDPCPLCIFQRVCYFFAGVFALLAALTARTAARRRGWAVTTAIPASFGAAFASRQIWLQHLPPNKVPACGPGLEYWLKTLPIAETIKRAVRGTGDCAEVNWTFLSLSIAEWSLICFVGIFVLSAWLLRTRRT